MSLEVTTMELLGGHPALDFVNTVGGRTHSTAVRYVVDREHLLTVDDLFAWAVEAEIVKPRRSTAASLKRALGLRESLYRIFKAFIDDRKPDARDLEVLNRELAEARSHERLSVVEGRATIVSDDR